MYIYMENLKRNQGKNTEKQIVMKAGILLEIKRVEEHFKIPSGKKMRPRIVNLMEISFIKNVKINNFSHIQMWEQFHQQKTCITGI